MRSLQGSEARPLTWAQPVMPGLICKPAALALGVLGDLHRDRGARADERHLATHHVQEIGQLIQRSPTQKRPHSRDSGIVLVDRQARADVLRAVDHRAQLEQVERPPSLPTRR